MSDIIILSQRGELIMDIFNYNGKLYNFLNKFWNLVWISVLWIVCSIPIVTIGASSCAAYYSMVKNVRHNEDRATRDFFKSFKANFKQATVMTIIFIVAGVLFSYATYFYYNRSGSFNLGLRWLFYIIILVYLCVITYAFSWLSRFEMSTFHAVTYPIAVTLMHLKFSVGLIIFWAAMFIVAYWSYNTFFFAPFLVIAPGLKCLLDTFLIEQVLKKYEPMAQAAAEELEAKKNGNESEKIDNSESNEVTENNNKETHKS